MNEKFHISRQDGRSNQQVVIDLVKNGEPGHVYQYADFIKALNAGTDRVFTRIDVRSIVIQANRRLLKEQQRTLHNVRLTGYRLAFAHEHGMLVVIRKHRSDVQLRHGVRLLRNVRWEELDPNQRLAHEGELLVIGGLYEQQCALDRRLRRIEQALKVKLD